ncbi:MAG TPA: ABC transporter ATP-binding protein [Acidimicrobiales bacterium]|nr:ABC transporter ATP-binding protein [Acidimicrobiales bacterium]
MLELRQVEVVYNKLATAVSGVSLSVEQGAITTLLGTNGAGKTTTLKTISGFLRSENADITEGEILFEGRDIRGLAPHEVSKLGIALVPERDKVFDTLTVDENLRAASVTSAGVTEAYELFERLNQVRTRLAGYLSGGEKQLLAMAMALSTKPRLLLVDELSLGLAPIIVSRLLADLQRVQKDLGLTVLLVEQNAAAALRVANYGYVIEDGRIVFDGDADRLLNHGDIMEFYLGAEDDEGERRSYRDVRQYRRKRRWWG